MAAAAKAPAVCRTCWIGISAGRSAPASIAGGPCRQALVLIARHAGARPAQQPGTAFGVMCQMGKHMTAGPAWQQRRTGNLRIRQPVKAG